MAAVETVETPQRRLTGQEFEELCRFALDRAKRRRECDAGRYGVQGSFRDGVWAPIKSLPDFEGALPGGRQFVFDAKVCSAASLSLAASKVTERQITHMLNRGRMGVPCFLLVHWNARRLAKRNEEAWTAAVPIHPEGELWERWAGGSQKKISRREAKLYGCCVPWTLPTGARNAAPGILKAVALVAEGIEYENARWHAHSPQKSLPPVF